MTATLDCFMVFSELDMCDLRFNVLRDAADWHIVVESGMTHSGKPKPPYFGDALQSGRFDAFASKIVYYYADTLDGANSWERERFNRWLISKPLALIAQPDDLVIVSDCDEIPNPDALANVPPTGAALDMEFYYYTLNRRVKMGWGVGVLPYQAEADPNAIRTLAGHDVPHLADGGWHMSYFATPEGVALKLDSFMHAGDIALNVPRDPKWLGAKMKAGEDIFERGMQIEYVPLSENLPRYVWEHQEKYVELGWVE